MGKFLAGAGLLLAASSMIAVAQEGPKNEIAGGVGHTFISDQTVPNTNFFDNTVHSANGWTIAVGYTRQLHDYRWGAFGIEIPVIYNPDEDLNYGQNQVPKQYSSLFITPAAHVSFMRNLAFSPWISFGGGLGHFVASKDLVFYGTNTGDRIKTTGTLHGGVGFDVRIPGLHSLRFRFEARDNWSGAAPINVNTGNTHQHNLYVGGGAVFPF
jgi:hypothetical protein